MDGKLGLEMALSGFLTRARVIERVLHEPDLRWYFRFAGIEVPASPQLTGTGVTFTWKAWFPVEARVELVCDRDTVLCGALIDADEDDLVEWTISLGSTVPA